MKKVLKILTLATLIASFSACSNSQETSLSSLISSLEQISSFESSKDETSKVSSSELVNESSKESSKTSSSVKQSSSEKESSSTNDDLKPYEGYIDIEDINDEYSEPTSYYNSAKGKVGEELKTSLYNIIKGHKTYAYSSLADCMTYTDRDWNLSPSKSDTNPYMHLIYSTYNGTNDSRRNKVNTSWDKEHIWAKSHGDFGTSQGAGSDLHHIRASDKNNNNQRSSLEFLEVTIVDKVVNDYSGNKSGVLGTNEKIKVKGYLPQACDKGDVARALFYMATRYYSEKGLKLQENPVGSTKNPIFGNLSTLLAWNYEDLPDEFERHRNNIIYEGCSSFAGQGNRNPFIDHPEYACYIWGETNEATRNVCRARGSK